MADVSGFDPAAWSIDGAQINSELMRVLAYAATGGSEGIVSPGDCKPRALSTPGAGITLDPGGLLIRNRSANVRNQTYAANGRSQTTLDVPAVPAGSARSDLVIVRVEDPKYAPWPTPAAGAAPTYPYVRPFVITGVPSTTRRFADLNLATPYSAYAVARIDRPASTGIVSPGNIVDLRELAQPRQSIYKRMLNAQQIQDYDLTSETWAFWPASGNGINSSITLPVPSWATRAVIQMDLNSFAHVAPGFVGELRILLDTVSYPPTAIDLDLSVGAEHVNQSVVAEFDVTGFQGRSVPIALQGRRWAGYTGRLRTRPSTQYVLTANFYEDRV